MSDRLGSGHNQPIENAEFVTLYNLELCVAIKEFIRFAYSY